MSTPKSHRFFALFLALLFLVTSSAVTIAVVLTMVNQNKQQDKTANNPASQAKEDKKLQGTQLENFTPTNKIDQLQAIDTVPGPGPEVKAGESVTADYTGAVAATGVIFQSSKDLGQAITFDLKKVIAGWSQGIPGMKVGGTRRLLIPAALAYGANPPQDSGIPPNADLVFDVTLHDISK
ncbi:MAG TPA: FKBP-type peptidyl-prolyl cis-trans isomerase [Candidatus Saccharimonadales bacterium]|nr:FKBP-type peptidyl-prolyl cis-trans isomerase [Candidatus Saccharimonadales bacterium]